MKLSVLSISEDDLDALQARLNAVLDIYRGKDTSGSDIDTMELTRALPAITVFSSDLITRIPHLGRA